MEAKESSTWSSKIPSLIQYLGMTVSMVGGAHWPAPRWGTVGAGLLVLGVGIFFARRAQRHSQNAVNAGQTQSLEHIVKTSVESALKRTIALAANGTAQATQATADEADAIVRECVEAVAQQQEKLTQKYGFAGYASVMTPLASGERWLFRTWSAASDVHEGEVRASLEAATISLREALEAAETLLRA